MVPKHEDDGGLLLLGEVVHQHLEGLVRLVGQGQVLLRHGVLARLVGELDLGGVVLHGVAAVVLDGDVEQEQGLSRLLVLKLPDDLSEVGPVAHVAVLQGLLHVHVLAALEVVEAQPGIGLVPLPGGALPRVEGQGAVPLLPQQGGQGGGVVQNVLLVGDAARGQEGHGVPRQKLKFAGAGARPEDGGVGVAPDRVVQGADVVGDALREGEGAELLKVRPGLVHNGDDIGVVGAHRRLLREFHLVHDPAQPLGRQVLRLLHLHKLRVAQKGGHRAALLIGPQLVPYVGLHAEPAQGLGMYRLAQAEDAQDQGETAEGGGAPVDEKAALPEFVPQEPGQKGHQGDPGQHGAGGGEGVAPRHRRRRPQGGQIPGEHRRPPVQGDKVVGRSPHPAQDMEKQTAHRRVARGRPQQKIDRADAQAVGQHHTGGQLPGEDPQNKLHQIKTCQGRKEQQRRLLQALPGEKSSELHKFSPAFNIYLTFRALLYTLCPGLSKGKVRCAGPGKNKTPF